MKLHDIALQVPLELKGHTQGVAEIWLAPPWQHQACGRLHSTQQWKNTRKIPRIMLRHSFPSNQPLGVQSYLWISQMPGKRSCKLPHKKCCKKRLSWTSEPCLFPNHFWVQTLVGHQGKVWWLAGLDISWQIELYLVQIKRNRKSWWNWMRS